MDDPLLDQQEHFRALRGLRRLNRITNSYAPLWTIVKQLSEDVARPISVLDIGCGGGDALTQLGMRARKHNLSLSLNGFDISSTALEHAAARIEEQGLKATFHQHDILTADDSIQSRLGPYDVVYCSLFLHHFSNEQAVTILASMARFARLQLVVSDLRRTAVGYGLAVLGTRLFSRSPIVHVDGPRSVEAAFTTDEILEVSRLAGLCSAKTSRVWPERFLLQWSPQW